MIKKYFLLLFVLFCTNAFSQVILKSESINKNKYRLIFNNELNYKLTTQDGETIIKFNGYKNEENPGSFILPKKEIFIAIPPHTKPTVNFTILKSKSISAAPEINKAAVYLNDSTAVYKNVPLNLSHISNNTFKVKGFLWIKNNYCIQISVNLFEYNFNKRVVSENKEFSIELTFNENLPKLNLEKNIGNSQNKISEELISNPVFAQSVKSNEAKYKIADTDSWIDYSKDYLKIGTAADAVYRIYFSDLTKFGIDANSINPKTFKLFYKGNEIPIYVSGQNDNIFNSNDFIEFVGQKNYGDKDYREPAPYGSHYREYLNIYSDTTIYWLTWNGSDGKRVDTTTSTSGSLTQVDHYDELIHTEENKWYDFSLSGGVVRREDPAVLENETWEWWTQTPRTQNFNFSISDLYPNKSAEIFVKLQSWAADISKDAHDLALKVNSDPAAYDSGFIDKYQVKVLKANFNSSKLSDGKNILNIISYPTQASVNSIFGDWFEVVYPRYLKAINDSLNFSFRSISSPTPSQVKISNINPGNIILYKYYDDNRSIKITNYIRNLDTLIFIDTLKSDTKYLLISQSKINKPVFYYKKKFVDLRSPANKADYILITHPVFIPLSEKYVQFIENNYNVTAKVVNVFDIYDEFNYGFFAPEPIKEFLKAANNFWQSPKPSYLFIVGKATYDFYGNKTKYFGAPQVLNFVPSYGDPVSDPWFVMWDSTNANVPQMNVGRLPAKNVQEFQHYFDKHKNYLSKGFDDWNKKYLFFSGGNFTDPGQIAQLKNVNDFVINNYVKPSPIGGEATHFYKTINPLTNFGPFSASQIQNAVDQGEVFISYLGHSGTQTWDNTITDIDQLNNKVNRNPLITDFGCSTGKFAEPDVTSFSEFAVSGLKGQAIAYIGNSSLGFTSTSFSFPQLFFGTILADSVYNIGEAHRLAKIKLMNTYGSLGSYRLFLFTNTLIGDPIISLQIPPKPNLNITSKDFKISPAIPNDQDDSVKVNLYYNNFGRVLKDSINIFVKEEFADSVILQKNIFKNMPLFVDSVSISIPIKNQAGNHKISIELDPDNKTDELYENDNNISFSFNVASTSVRNLNSYLVENQIDGSLMFINPNIKPSNEKINIQVSGTSSFSNPSNFTVPFDSFFTKFKLNNSYNNSRVWIRSKISNTNSFGIAQSFFVGSKNDYLLNDSLSFSTAKLHNLKIIKNEIAADTSKITFSVFSAGYNDGRTANIIKNGQNYIPENTLGGAHVCLFDANTFDFVEYKLFGDNNAFINFIDTLSSKYLVLIGVADNKYFSADLKNEIKTLGSIYIDSTGYRTSWAIIGRKGAAPGSVPEAFSRPFQGPVRIDTTINIPFKEGNLTTSKIGPADKWKSLNVNQAISGNSKINYRVFRINKEGKTDTVNLNLNNSTADLSFIDAKKYPYIIVSSEFQTDENQPSPKLNSLEVDYSGVPELGTNYQVVSLLKDTVESGEKNSLSFYVYNAGGSAADSFKVKVKIEKPDNSKEEILSENVNSIVSEGKKLFKANYINKGKGGKYTFHIEVDPENKITELYKDNNIFDVPFYVKGDTTSLSVTASSFTAKYDGLDILDGDYISNNPNIEMTLNYPIWFPAQDTSAVEFYLDNNKIPYSNLQIVYKEASRINKYNYLPKLSDGEHSIKVFGINNLGKIEASPGYEKTFVVSEQAKILNVYNYPNPFKNDTYFTFKLTQIPDELKIKIFTIAGRLIKEIKRKSSELNFDFNKIYWDGRDEDGDLIANGVYLYKVIMKKGNKTEDITQKLAVMR